MGFDPMVQVIHERDVAEAVRLSLRRGARGIFNLRGPGEVPLSHVFRVLGRKPVSVPASLLEAGLARAFRLRMTSFPSPEVDHIRYVASARATTSTRRSARCSRLEQNAETRPHPRFLGPQAAVRLLVGAAHPV
jgi:UDP-glucose 4-epimerase